MTPAHLFTTWKDIAAAVGDHLWQSTVFGAVAGLLTLTLRKNHACARYWVWLAASVKFLIPFSALVALGKHMTWLCGSTQAQSGAYFTIEEISQPFTQPAIAMGPRIASPVVASGLSQLLPGLLIGSWLCGLVVVLLVWCIRWRRMSVALHDAVRLREGREVEALRRVEHVTGMRQRVELLLSRSTLEPGIFGMVRPMLLWPEGISERLDNAHLEAILAHELWHVRRRDNLAAAVHMVVEAIYWFHPLVWWLGGRLVDERERACDEQVLELGSERHVYAESILKVCEFCVGSPLACVAGVTGADLKKRMVHIMSEQGSRKLDFGRKMLLSAVTAVAIVAPIIFGLAQATLSRAQSQDETTAASAPAFESATIRPSQLSTPTYAGSGVHMVRMAHSPQEFTAANITMKALLEEAYGVQANQIVGGPEWLDSAAFDVDAKTGKTEGNLTLEQRAAENQRMLQTFLTERTKLVLHHETKEIPSYALVVADGGAKLQPSQTGNNDADGPKGPDGKPLQMHRMMMQLGGGEAVGLSARGTSVGDFAQQLSRQLGSAVVDKTGLKGNYDFNLQWGSASGSVPGGTEDSADSPSSLFTSIQEQLGLKLEPQKEPMDVLVIDQIEKPAEN